MLREGEGPPGLTQHRHALTPFNGPGDAGALASARVANTVIAHEAPRQCLASPTTMRPAAWLPVIALQSIPTPLQFSRLPDWCIRNG